MNDLVEGCRIEGEVNLDGENVYAKGTDVNLLRRRVGMVFQKPNPFPMSVFDNVAFGPRTHGIKDKAKLEEIVENALRKAAIWDERKTASRRRARPFGRPTAASASAGPGGRARGASDG